MQLYFCHSCFVMGFFFLLQREVDLELFIWFRSSSTLWWSWPFIGAMKSSPRLTSPRVLSHLLLSRVPVVVCVCWVIRFYLWRNCSQYHVQILSGNDTYTRPSAFPLPLSSQIDLSGHRQETYNESLCFIPNITVVCFNFISPPPALWKPSAWCVEDGG